MSGAVPALATGITTLLGALAAVVKMAAVDSMDQPSSGALGRLASATAASY